MILDGEKESIVLREREGERFNIYDDVILNKCGVFLASSRGLFVKFPERRDIVYPSIRHIYDIWV